jgi:hypothetical protein
MPWWSSVPCPVMFEDVLCFDTNVVGFLWMEHFVVFIFSIFGVCTF